MEKKEIKEKKAKEKKEKLSGKKQEKDAVKEREPRAVKRVQKRVMNASPDDIPLMWKNSLKPQPKGATKLIKQLNHQQRIYTGSKNLERSE